MKRIDLNVDIGEGFPYDGDLLRFATSGNICAGEHAGSWDLTVETIHRCQDAGVRIGMHPGYPDRHSMGRRTAKMEDAAAYVESIRSQVERFFSFVPAAYLKPHGAFYNDATDDSEAGTFARSLIESLCLRFPLPLMALPGTLLAHVATAARVPLIREGFADRAYLADGRLVPRSAPGAVLEDSAAVREQVLRLAESADSICLHGDTPGCVAFAEDVFSTLVDAGYEVSA